MPFYFARHGLLSKSVSEDDITALCIEAVNRSLGPFHAATLDAAIAAIEQDLLSAGPLLEVL